MKAYPCSRDSLFKEDRYIPVITKYSMVSAMIKIERVLWQKKATTCGFIKIWIFKKLLHNKVVILVTFLLLWQNTLRKLLSEKGLFCYNSKLQSFIVGKSSQKLEAARQSQTRIETVNTHIPALISPRLYSLGPKLRKCCHPLWLGLLA